MSHRHFTSMLVAALLVPGVLSAQSRQERDEQYRSDERRAQTERSIEDRERGTARGEERARQDDTRARLGEERRTAKSNISVETQVEPLKLLPTEDQRGLSVAAGRILVHTNEARTAIQRGNTDTALDNVEKALTLTEIVQRNVPTYRVETNISSGDLEYSDRSEVAALLVPVYSELERVSVVGPVLAAKTEGSFGQDSSMRQEQQRRTQRSRSERGMQQSRSGTAASAESRVSVLDVGLVNTSMYLNVNTAQAHLEAAEQALEQDDTQRADSLLRAVQQGVIVSQIESELPVADARANLMAAKLLFEEGRTDEAQRKLKNAASKLEQFEKSAGESQAQEISSIRKELNQTARNMPESEREFSQQIDRLWDQLRGLQA